MSYEMPYVAGLVDADGVIGLRATRSKTLSHDVVVGVAMCAREIPETLHAMFGGSFHVHSRESVTHRTCWNWQVFGGRAAEVAAALHPWLVIKRRQAEIVIAYQSTRLPPGRRSAGVPADLVALRTEMHREITALNRKGPVPNGIEALAS